MKQESEEEYLPQKRYKRSKKATPGKSLAAKQNGVKEMKVIAKPVKWSCQENQAYVSFLKENSNQFVSYLEKKRARTFILMSQTVKTRTSYQCKSHHQKMIQKYGGIQEIIMQIPRNSDDQKDPQEEKENPCRSDHFEYV